MPVRQRRVAGLAAASLVLAVTAAASFAPDPPARPAPTAAPSASTTSDRVADPQSFPSQLEATPTASATPEPPATEPPAPEPPRTVTLVATGDLLLHERLWKQAGDDAAATGAPEMDYAPMLGAVAPYVSAADLAVCHLETPLAPAGGPYAGYPLFSAPPSIVTALDALGYDACSTASNHVFDQGAAGLARTLDTLDAAGLAHAGSARTPEEAATTTMLDVAGVDVALLSFTYGFNGIPYPGGETWRAPLIDAGAITAAAAAARTRGAQIVVVALHWGTEYRQGPDQLQLEVAPAVAASPDVDLVIGHHAHVVQPVEKLGRTWVAYGLGNLVAAHREPGEPRSEGLLVRFTFTEQPGPGGRFEATAAEYLPLLVTDPFPVRVLDVPAALAAGAYGSTTRERLETALARTTAVVESRGGVAAGLRRLG